MPEPLTLYLAAPRGFCAGVDRAIQIVELALEKWGAPVYVRHEIVHNRFVVDGLKAKGAVFVEELAECPPDRPVVFSAHGVPKSVPAEAEARRMLYLDATCPLVSKVHVEADRHHENGLQMVMIGHAGHPEVIGTMGQLPPGAVLLVETAADVAAFAPTRRGPARLHHPDHALGRRHRRDRRGAARPLPGDRRAAQGGHLLRHHQPPGGGQGDGADDRRAPGDRRAQLLELAAAGRGRPQAPAAATPSWCSAPPTSTGARSTAPARSASPPAPRRPEVLVEEVIAAFRARYDVTEELVETAREHVEFKVPRILRAKVA